MERTLTKLNIDLLIPSNYRDVKGDFEDIKNSMLEKGQLEPLTVTPELKEGKETGSYIIVNGERRYRAAKFITDSSIESNFDFANLDCIVDKSYNIDTNSEDFKLNQLILNEVRKGSTFDTYLAVKNLVDSKKYNRSQISRALGKDESWSGKISNLIIDSVEYRAYYSGNHLFYDNRTGKVTDNFDEFSEIYKDIITKREGDRVTAFLSSNFPDQSIFEKENGKIFETEELKDIYLYRGFGDDAAPSIWTAQKLVEFWNRYCVDHKRSAEARSHFSKMIKVLMTKRIKSKTDIDKLVQAVERKIFGEEDSPSDREPVKVSASNVAKKIFNVFKDVEFTPDELKEVKKELRALFKDAKYRDRVNVSLSLYLKKDDDEQEDGNK